MSQPHTVLLLMRRTIVLHFAASLPELATNELEIYINKHELTFNAKINNILFDCVSLNLQVHILVLSLPLWKFHFNRY